MGDFIKSFGSSQNILIWTLNTFTFLWQKFAGLVCLCTCKLDTNSKYTQWEQNLLLSKVQKSIDFCEYIRIKRKGDFILANFYFEKTTTYNFGFGPPPFSCNLQKIELCKYSF